MGDSNKHFVRGAAIGALLASVATLLLAPKSGKKTRADVQKLVTSLTKQLNKKAEQMADITRETYEDLVNTTMKEYARGKKLTKGAIDEISGVLKSNWTEVRKELKKK